MSAAAPPDHCQGMNVDGSGCREHRGLRWCSYYGLWYCRRHHAARLARGTGREEHRAACREEEGRAPIRTDR